MIVQKRGIESVDQYLNAIGNVALIMLVTLTLAVLLPFHCLPNPTGTKAMASIPSLLCWQRRHNIMAALGVAGIIFYPVGIFSVVVWIIWKFPAFIAAGRSIVLIKRCKWLFNRFRPERYYFGLSYLLRGGTLSLVPVAFPAEHVQQ